jgi:hypothetical protein
MARTSESAPQTKALHCPQTIQPRQQHRIRLSIADANGIEEEKAIVTSVHRYSFLDTQIQGDQAPRWPAYLDLGVCETEYQQTPNESIARSSRDA